MLRRTRCQINGRHDQLESLQRLQERHEVRLLLGGQADLEARVVELHCLLERRGRAVVEIRRARGQRRAGPGP